MKFYLKPNRRIEIVEGSDFKAPSDWVETDKYGVPVKSKPSAPKVKKVSNPPADEESAGGEE
tara:strand:- start:12708 stop:12893 length:186 start_codon:yes stop_codon:yes gene_type:complete